MTKKPKKQKLIPPDPNQCQAEVPVGTNAFTIGGPNMFVRERCKNKPTVIVKENKPGPDGQRGSMSLCDGCLKQLVKQLGSSYATAKPIKKEEE